MTSVETELNLSLWCYLLAELRRFNESLEDDRRSERPSTVTTDENIGCVHHMLTDDRRLMIKQLANAISLSRVRGC